MATHSDQSGLATRALSGMLGSAVAFVVAVVLVLGVGILTSNRLHGSG